MKLLPIFYSTVYATRMRAGVNIKDLKGVDPDKFDKRTILAGDEWEEAEHNLYGDDELDPYDDPEFDMDEMYDEYYGEQDEDYDHDDDDEHFDHHTLNIDEKHKRFKKLIVKMDLNKDKEIDREELAKWVLKALQRMDEKNMDDDFEVADTNRDGLISFEEYVTGIYNIKPELVFEFTKNDVLRSPELRDYNRVYHREFSRFQVSDTNEDTFLDVVEYKEFYNPSHNHTLTDSAILLALEHTDTNKDGMLNFEEFINEGKIREIDMLEKDRGAYQEIFHNMDLNDNNQLDGLELYFWISQDNGEIAVDEVDHLILNCDEDMNDVLSYDEILHKMDEFLESDATEYGNMLQHDEL